MGVLNVAGYFDGLTRFLAQAVREGFVSPENFGLLLFGDTPEELLDLFITWQPPALPRAWLDATQA